MESILLRMILSVFYHYCVAVQLTLVNGEIYDLYISVGG